MRKLILATAGVAVVAFVAATLGSAQPTATTATAGSQAKAPVLPKLPADIAARKRLIVGVKCDTPPFGYLDVRGKNAGVDVEIARQLARYAFGTRAKAHVRLRADGRPRAAADQRPRRHGHLDVHVHVRPRHPDRLLEAVLQSVGAAARQERLADQHSRRHPRQEGGDDERLGLRPLDEAVLPDHRGDRRGQRHERRPRLQPGPGRRGHVRRHVPRADRCDEPLRRR